MKIQKNTLLIASFVLAGLASCNADTSDKAGVLIENPESAPVSAEAQMPEIINTTPSEPAQNVVLNPAHGEPGHDCAFPVGAPLTGSAGAPTPAPAAVTAAPPAPSPLGGPIPKFNANANLNPAHGMPGHDCAVAVGAPLPSK